MEGATDSMGRKKYNPFPVSLPNILQLEFAL